MAIDTSFFGWILAAGFGLFMVHRNIMQRITDVQRMMHEDVKMQMESVRMDMDYHRDRHVRLSDRVDALELACGCKSQKESKAYYNTEA